MVVGVRRSRTGRVLIAIRENEQAARAYGVNATRTSLAAFALSGFLAAVAGALYVHQQTGLSAEPFLPEAQPRAVHDGRDRRARVAARCAARRHLRATRPTSSCPSSGSSWRPAPGCCSCCSCSRAGSAACSPTCGTARCARSPPGAGSSCPACWPTCGSRSRPTRRPRRPCWPRRPRSRSSPRPSEADESTVGGRTGGRHDRRRRRPTDPSTQDRRRNGVDPADGRADRCRRRHGRGGAVVTTHDESVAGRTGARTATGAADGGRGRPPRRCSTARRRLDAIGAGDAGEDAAAVVRSLAAKSVAGARGRRRQPPAGRGRAGSSARPRARRSSRSACCSASTWSTSSTAPPSACCCPRSATTSASTTAASSPSSRCRSSPR